PGGTSPFHPGTPQVDPGQSHHAVRGGPVPPAVRPCEAYRKREDGGAPAEMRFPVCESRAGYARTPLAPRDATGDYGAHATGSRVNPAGDGMRLLGVLGATW